MQIIGYVLFAVHWVLLFWALGGFCEMFMENVFWRPFTNPLFPNWLLLLHWGSVLFASTCFIVGFIKRWCKTPQYMVYAYGTMALVCIIETFGYMTGQFKYIALILECVMYLSILTLLFWATYFKRHFAGR